MFINHLRPNQDIKHSTGYRIIKFVVFAFEKPTWSMLASTKGYDKQPVIHRFSSRWNQKVSYCNSFYLTIYETSKIS